MATLIFEITWSPPIAAELFSLLDNGHEMLAAPHREDDGRITLQWPADHLVPHTITWDLFAVGQDLTDLKAVACWEHGDIKQVSVCTVVPEVLHSVKNACLKYFNLNPFILQAGVKTGLKVKYKNPLEVGADRIANAIAGTQMYPGENLLIIDFGTATTFCAVTAEKDYLGGVIIAGIGISAYGALSVIMAMIFLKEKVSPGQWVGLVMIVAGVATLSVTQN